MVLGPFENFSNLNLDPLFLSLRKSMKFLGHCRYSKFFEIQIVHELCVFCDGLFGHRVDNTIAHLFGNDDVAKAVRRLVEGSGDGLHRRCGECKVDDMVEGLACNVGRSLWRIELDSRQGGL